VIVAVLVVMFVNIATVLETIATVGYETFRIDWHWDRALSLPDGSTLQLGIGRDFRYLAPVTLDNLSGR